MFLCDELLLISVAKIQNVKQKNRKTTKITAQAAFFLANSLVFDKECVILHPKKMQRTMKSWYSTYFYFYFYFSK